VKRKAVGHDGIYLLEIAGTWRKEGKKKYVDYNEFMKDLIKFLA